MIYILVGNDLKKKNSYIKTLKGSKEDIFLTEDTFSRELLINYAMNPPLFGEAPIVIVDNLIGGQKVILSPDDFLNLKESQTIFVFLEDKLLAVDEKKYKKYATVEKFLYKEIKQTSLVNVFNITDAFAERNKIKAWSLYSQAIEAGIPPESISGILFWKIKMMILNKNKTFSLDTLKKQSSEIVSLYHLSHRGERDFIVGLEQFILDSLNRK